MSMSEKDRRYKRPESVLVVVYTRSNEILALRRKQPNYFWQSVAGSLEWARHRNRLRNENSTKKSDCPIQVYWSTGIAIMNF